MSGNVQYLNTDGKNFTPVSAANPLPVAAPTLGALDDAAWDGTGNPASLIALLKAIYAKTAEVATNTAA